MKRILVVEDDVISAESIKITLNDNGYDVEYALSEIEAIQSIERYPPDILLQDINLSSDNDGIFVADSAMKINPHVKIIFITGYTKASYSERLKNIDYIAYLEKPLDFPQLLQMIRSIE